jgi:CheY-like chemotaxis protein
MLFPLYHRPNALVFLDDDASYLEMLALVMPNNWSVRLYTRVDDCILSIQHEHELWEADVWAHHNIVENWRKGAHLLLQVLHYWETVPHRYSLTQTCIVDYAMPAMTGLEVLKALPIWPTHRVLLTGQADEMVAVSAFNERLIDKFVTKQYPDIGRHLTQLLTQLHATPMEILDPIWHSTLKQEQYAALQEVTAQQTLQMLVQKLGWVEYVVIAAPFGILGLNAHAQASWLQLELVNDLPCAADLAKSTGQTSSAVEKIRIGTHFDNTELLMALSSNEAICLAPTLAIGNKGSLLGAIFQLSSLGKLGTSHYDFLNALPPRVVAQ